MAIHIQPIFRSREGALERAGLLVDLKSTGVIALRALEISKQASRTVPLVTYKFNGVNDTPNPNTSGTP